MNVFSMGNFIAVILIAISGIYLWGVFTNDATQCTADMLDDPLTLDEDESRHGCTSASDTYTKLIVPATDELETSSLWIVRLLLYGGAALIGVMVVSKFVKGNFRVGKRDIMTMIVLAAIVWAAWTYVIEPSNILGAERFADIEWKTAAKLGLLK